MVERAFDVVLCFTLVGVAGGAILGRDVFVAVALFVVYGLLLSIAWVRLEAIDVALAEAAIGAGLTGILLLGVVARLRSHAPDKHDLRPLTVLLCLGAAAGLGWAVLELSGRHAGLRPLVEQNLTASGVDNPVTAVLLNFRGWDTLLEVVVLTVALIGVWTLAPDAAWGRRPGLRQHLLEEGVLETFGRFLAPLGLVVGLYVVWTGTSAPGGAFQAGTILAAVWLLTMMAGLSEPPAVSRVALRLALVAGPFAFVLVGLLGLASGAFLSFPERYARILIITVELALTLSIAATLSMLVLGPPRRVS